MREGIIGAVFFYLTGYSLVVLAYVKFNDLEFSGPANYQSIIALTTLLGTIWLFIGIIKYYRSRAKVYLGELLINGFHLSSMVAFLYVVLNFVTEPCRIS